MHVRASLDMRKAPNREPVHLCKPTYTYKSICTHTHNLSKSGSRAVHQIIKRYIHIYTHTYTQDHLSLSDTHGQVSPY